MSNNTSDSFPSNMAAVECAVEEIRNRLKKILYHFNQLDALQKECPKYRGEDLTKGKGHPRFDEFFALEDQIKFEELHTFEELHHLRDNVAKYISRKITCQDDKDIRRQVKVILKEVDDSYCYSVASNLANVHKHGVPGENHPAASLDINVSLFSEQNPTINESQVQHVGWIINYEGNCIQSERLRYDLCHIWEIFLRNNTSLDITEFSKFLRNHDTKNFGAKHKTAKLPPDFIEYARQVSRDRRYLLKSKNTALPQAPAKKVHKSEQPVKARLELIIDEICNRERSRRKLAALRHSSWRAGDEKVAGQINNLKTLIQSSEVRILKLLVELSDVIGDYVKETSKPIKSLNAILHCRSYEVAKHVIEREAKKMGSGSDLFLILSAKKANNEKEFADIINFTRFELRCYPWPNVILDLSRLYETTLRHETDIEFKGETHWLFAVMKRYMQQVAMVAHIKREMKLLSDPEI